jgi:hypothetical protein
VLIIYRKDCLPELHHTLGAMMKKFILSIGVMKLGTGTNSTTGNSLVTLSTTGHLFFEWSLYHLITWNLMKLCMGTKSTMKNSLIILSTSGHHIFEWSLYQLTTGYFANIMMKLSMGTKSTMKNSLVTLLTMWSLVFRMVTLSTDHLLFCKYNDEIKCGY